MPGKNLACFSIGTFVPLETKQHFRTICGGCLIYLSYIFILVFETEESHCVAQAALELRTCLP